MTSSYTYVPLTALSDTMNFPSSTPRQIVFNVQNTMLSIPATAIEGYPYSRLADLASASVHDDPVYISSSPAAFAVLRNYLITKNLEVPAEIPESELTSLFSDLGIPFPGSTQSHFAAAGDREGGVRAWDAFASTVVDEEYTDEMRAELKKIEGARLYQSPFARAELSHSSMGYGEGALPSYGEAMLHDENGLHSLNADQEKVEQSPTEFLEQEVFTRFPKGLVDAIHGFKAHKTVFVLTPAEPVAKANSWDAKPQNEVLGFYGSNEIILVPVKEWNSRAAKEAMLRRGDGVLAALGEWEPKKDGFVEISSTAIKQVLDLRQLQVDVKIDDEVGIRGVTPMGLFETRWVKATVIEFCVRGL